MTSVWTSQTSANDMINWFSVTYGTPNGLVYLLLLLFLQIML